MLPIFSDVVKPLNSCFSRVRLVRMVQRFCGEENVGKITAGHSPRKSELLTRA